MDGFNQTPNKGGQPRSHFHDPRHVPIFLIQFLQPVFNCFYFVSPALWEYESRHNGALPDEIDQALELTNIANALISTLDVNKQVLSTIPPDLIEYAFYFSTSLELTRP
jgi:hypothetical protein